MGWTSLRRDKGLSDRQFFEREMPSTLVEHGQIVACTTKAGSGHRVFYAAVRGLSGHPDPEYTWAFVALLGWIPTRDPGAFNFFYKEMDETMGPGEDNCPIRILNLLSATDSQYANEWRARCRRRAAFEVDARQRKAALTQGVIVRFDTPYDFGSQWGPARLFRYRQIGQRTEWDAMSPAGRPRFRCRLPRNWWKDRRWVLAALCGNCGRVIRNSAGVDPSVPWVHEDSGNGYCDVACTEDAVRLAGSPDRPEAIPA